MFKESEQNIREDTFNVLHTLSSNDNFTQRDLSVHLGISLGKTNYLLKSLVKKNFIKARNFSRNGNKLRKVKYILTKRGIEEKVSLTYHFLKRKEAEYNRIREEWRQLKMEQQLTGSKSR